jgi:two-component sensor histidine kinase
LLYDGRDADGQVRMHAVAPLLDRDVFVMLSAPKPGLLFWARLNPFASIILPLMAWAAAWAAVAVVSERVVIRWLAYLERIAAIYARGRFSVRPVKVESAPAEIQALAHTLDVMAEAIVERDTSLRDSIAHKDALMREIHHRVKNNLQVITSLLNMQQRALTDPAARAAMSDTRQRITALALIYRALYQSPDLRRVDVRQFLEELVAHLTAGEGGRPSNVRTQLTADDLEIDPDKLAPLALFAVEAISNARKHAYGEDGGLIRVRFSVSAEEVELEIADEGHGPPPDEDAAGVGRTLMSAFARQLRGRAEIGPGEGGGVSAKLIFPAPEAGGLKPADPAAPAAPRDGNQAAA